MTFEHIDIKHIERIKQTICDGIKKETANEINSKYTIIDQINFLAEYQTATPERQAELQLIADDITAIRAVGKTKRDAVMACTSYEEIAVIVPPVEETMTAENELVIEE